MTCRYAPVPDAKPNLRQQWLTYCENAAASHKESKAGDPAPFYVGSRKIFRSRRLRFSCLDDSLQLADCGFTAKKLSDLKQLYLHEESLKAAVPIWLAVLERGEHGSATFHCFNHYSKGKGLHRKGVSRIRERVLAGLQRARGQGKRLGRPKARLPVERVESVEGLTNSAGADQLGVSLSTLKRWRRQAQ